MQILPPHFLDWHHPVAREAANFLISQVARVGSILDFSNHLALVPTREAGRRLQEALVTIAENNGTGGVFPPEILTPDAFLNVIAPPEKVAPRSASLLILAGIFLELDVENFTGIFPTPPTSRTQEWALNLAGTFLDLRKKLTDSPRFPDCESVSFFPENPEPERWKNLAAIEKLYRERLKKQGFADHDDTRRQTAMTPNFAEKKWEKIWLVALPSPSPLLSVALEKFSETQMTPLIAAPENLRDGFDEQGRIVKNFWLKTNPQWEDFFDQVLLVSHPDALADALKTRLPEENVSGKITTIGLLDETIAPVISQTITARGGAIYNPAGQPMRNHAWITLLRLLKNFLSGNRSRTIGELLHFAGFVAAMAPAVSLRDTLAEYDEICEKHLPDTTADLRDFCAENSPLPQVLDALEHWKNAMSEGDWTTSLGKLLGKISQKITPPNGTAAVWNSLETEFAKIKSLSGLYPEMTPAAWLDLLLREFETQRVYTDGKDGEVPLQGWLELLWDDAPHLILSGFNEGAVPSTINADPFLPGKFREKLGLQTNDDWLARDIYILEKLLAQRCNGTGRLDVLVLQTNSKNDPLKPSRLLLQCDLADLPERVRFLFSEPAAQDAEPAWKAGWKFIPPVPFEKIQKIKNEIAVTKLSDYLDCPFRFYLKHILKMEEKNAWKLEPDAREFGSAIHAALDAFGRDDILKNSNDADEISKFLDEKLDVFLRENYGTDLPMTVLIQRESASQRFAAFARKQAVLRDEGWEIFSTEITFEKLLGVPFRLNESGAIISGKIDRIDFHPTLGWRILDYKTSASAITPEEAHFAAKKETGWPSEYAEFSHLDSAGKARARCWRNLQLPLYRHLFGVAKSVPFDAVELAYFNLPKTLGDTGISVWENYDLTMENSALDCANGILSDIGRCHFWPPNTKPAHDDFKNLFFPTPENVVNDTAFLDGLEAAK